MVASAVFFGVVICWSSSISTANRKRQADQDGQEGASKEEGLGAELGMRSPDPLETQSRSRAVCAETRPTESGVQEQPRTVDSLNHRHRH
ncbi:hypothetical protein F2P81_000583 [Scophthalmus maximus]|uniref:Secreted protein n=1 Tax=Scophthalmus maximus TaxID=52904 RepID=A0A6A4TTJ9_SCOMX|nr:hypothetical protein F2P81_000583 [Scophthalmus maximus]